MKLVNLCSVIFFFFLINGCYGDQFEPETDSFQSEGSSGGRTDEVANSNCGSIFHGESETAEFFQSSQVAAGESCVPVIQSRICQDGVLGEWSGSLIHRTCNVAQEVSATLNDDIFFVGHSLIGPFMPEGLQNLVSDVGGTGRSDFQIINGSPLKWSWDRSYEGQGSDSRAVLPQGNHEVLVITEAVPLAPSIQWSDSDLYASQFYNLAVSGNPNISVYMYETWHCINSGTATGCSYDDNDDIPWRQRLTDDLAAWESIVDHVNSQKPQGAKEMLLVPAGQAMARIYDEIQSSGITGISSYRDLFSDDIHLSNLGIYYITMVFYGTLYQRSPVGLPRSLQMNYSTYQVPSAALALRLQELAWESVCSYPRSGVVCQ